MMKSFVRVAAVAAVVAGLGASLAAQTLLNVSYDPTRELYAAVNAAFIKQWQAKTGKTLQIRQSHGGSGSQARAVTDGLEADVVTLALAYDVDAVQKAGLITDAGWQKRLPQNSSPYTSTIVFLVRKGNPKGIKDWGDLVKPGIGVITPNPKTSGGARWNYLAAWEYGKRQGAAPMPRGATSSPRCSRTCRCWTPALAARPRRSCSAGSVTSCWRGRTRRTSQWPKGRGRSRSWCPSMSILAEPPVAIVDKVVDKRGTRAAADAYLQFLYSPEGQELAAKFHYRPRDQKVAAKYAGTFAQVKLFTIDQAFGGWQNAQKAHFADGGTFDQIYRPGTMKKTVLPGFRLTMGFTIFYLCLIVILPLLTLPARSATMTWDAFWQTISDPRVVASYRLSIGASLVAAADQRRVRADRGVGAGALHVSRGGGSSIRWSICRSRCRPRSPASR